MELKKGVTECFCVLKCNFVKYFTKFVFYYVILVCW